MTAGSGHKKTFVLFFYAKYEWEMLKKTRAKRKYKQWTEPVITSHPSTDGFSKLVLSNTLMFKKTKRKTTQPCRRVCDYMCPGLSADILQCAMSVCERETDKKRTEQGNGRWRQKRMSSGNRQRESRRGNWQSRDRKCCMCVGSQPCQAPVSRWFMAPRLGAVSSASSVLLLLTANEAGRAFKHST